MLKFYFCFTTRTHCEIFCCPDGTLRRVVSFGFPHFAFQSNLFYITMPAKPHGWNPYYDALGVDEPKPPTPTPRLTAPSLLGEIVSVDGNAVDAQDPPIISRMNADPSQRGGLSRGVFPHSRQLSPDSDIMPQLASADQVAPPHLPALRASEEGPLDDYPRDPAVQCRYYFLFPGERRHEGSGSSRTVDRKVSNAAVTTDLLPPTAVCAPSSPITAEAPGPSPQSLFRCLACADVPIVLAEHLPAVRELPADLDSLEVAALETIEEHQCPVEESSLDEPESPNGAAGAERPFSFVGQGFDPTRPADPRPNLVQLFLGQVPTCRPKETLRIPSYLTGTALWACEHKGRLKNATNFHALASDLPMLLAYSRRIRCLRVEEEEPPVQRRQKKPRAALFEVTVFVDTQPESLRGASLDANLQEEELRAKVKAMPIELSDCRKQGTTLNPETTQFPFHQLFFPPFPFQWRRP